MKFTIHQSSRQGPRPYNQDRLAYSYSKDALMMVVADGMGGHRNGEIAAQLAVKTLAVAFEKMAQPALLDPARFLAEHTRQVHAAINNYAEAHDWLDSPRTTIVAAIIQDNKLYSAHAGDSRLYHFSQGQLVYCSEDHSLVQMLYRKGLLQKRHMATHPERHKIYSCLGGDVPPQIDLGQPRELLEGDALLLCTDGLWTLVRDDEIGITLHASPINQALPELLDLAESRADKHDDNMSAIALHWGERLDDLLTISTLPMPLGATTTIISPISQLGQQNGGGGNTAPDLTDDEIERAIADIQAALRKTRR